VATPENFDETINSNLIEEYAGVVQVIYGSSQGLSDSAVHPDQFWIQGFANIGDSIESFDFFGDTLSSGDYNGDGRDDLAIGVPAEDIGTTVESGLVHVIYGSTEGLSGTALSPGDGRADQIWTQDSPDIEDAVEPFDNFGWSLSSGDYNGDG